MFVLYWTTQVLEIIIAQARHLPVSVTALFRLKPTACGAKEMRLKPDWNQSETNQSITLLNSDSEAPSMSLFFGTETGLKLLATTSPASDSEPCC